MKFEQSALEALALLGSRKNLWMRPLLRWAGNSVISVGWETNCNADSDFEQVEFDMLQLSGMRMFSLQN